MAAAYSVEGPGGVRDSTRPYPNRMILGVSCSKEWFNGKVPELVERPVKNIQTSFSFSHLEDDRAVFL